MSSVFSKNKEKRSRSTSNEANNSFVKNVTSRVSGFLPATITKWFSSPSSSNANGSTPSADATDSSTEDEAPETPVVTQPPSKRMRFSSPGKYNHFAPPDPNSVPTNIETNIEHITAYSTISTVQSPPGRSTFRRETNYVSTPVRAPNEETIIERSDIDSSMFKSQHYISNVGSSVATKRKSIFDTPPKRDPSMRTLKAATNNNQKTSSFKASQLGSPFYPGRTMYGGASMYINHPNIKQRKVALVNEAKCSDNTTMSHSARRVMDLLENYSSPLMEAKRISQFVNNSSNETSRNDTLDSTTISGSPYANKIFSYKTQELHVPNIATILRLKQRSRLMDTTNAARQIIASHSSTMSDNYIHQPYPSSNTQKEKEKDSNSKLTTKVKTRLTRQNRGDTIEMEEQLQPVNLPTAVLQIDKDNLPKFTFGNITPANTSNSIQKPNSNVIFPSTPATLPISSPQNSIKIGDPASSKPETAFTNDSYKFSSPVRISNDSQQISLLPPKFTFGSPERGIDKPKTDREKDDHSSIVVGTQKEPENISIPQSNGWKCPDCWVSNKPDAKTCVCCSAKQPTAESSKRVKCTICKLADSQSNSEKCVNCDKVLLNNKTTSPALKPADTAMWKCDDCWVSNDEDVENCVCCGGKNPKRAGSTKTSTSASTESEWKCEDCWIKNNANVDKCIACGGARLGFKQAVAPAPPSKDLSSMFRLPDKSLKNIVKSQSDKWECPSCLVRNENNRTKCVCCESDKPGLVKESDKKSFNFGMVTNTSFKFGIDPKAQESISTKLPEAKPSESLFNNPEESETNNNILPKTPSFTFGIPAKKADDQINTAKENNVTEPPKISGFTFGIPKSPTKIVSVAPALFGSSTKLTNSVLEKHHIETEKPQEVPKIDFKFSNTTDSSVKVMFGASLNSQDNTNKMPSAPTTLLNPLMGMKNKETSAHNLTLQPSAISVETEKPKNTFTFSPINTAPNLFGSPASTASSFAIQSPATTTAAPISLFQNSDTSSAPALSMFQKPNLATTSTISLFQKNETAITTAPPSMGTTAPVFSFGSNNAQPAAPSPFGENSMQTATAPTFGTNAAIAAPMLPEKPKFNFTFGGNTQLFNNTNTFGAPPETNKFGITGNNLGGNGLSGLNPMGGGNLLGPGKLGGEMCTTPLNSGSEMTPAPNLFGAPPQKENLWSSTNSNSTNLFATNSTTNPVQKPATFTFGSSTPFSANSSPAPAFGSNPTPSHNMFGMNQNVSAAPTLFGSPVQQSQPAPSMFGSPQASTPAPAMNMFGTPSVGATPTFGTPNPSIPSFEAPSLTPAPAPAFNFGAPQTSGVFGFGQQQQQQQQMPQQMSQHMPQQMPQQMSQQSGVYSFGATPGGPQVQFNMGSAPNTGVRRVRKAVRRNPQR